MYGAPRCRSIAKFNFVDCVGHPPPYTGLGGPDGDVFKALIEAGIKVVIH